MGANFALLKAHFARLPAHAWVEPTEENPSIHSRLLGEGISVETVQLFQDALGKAAYEAMRPRDEGEGGW